MNIVIVESPNKIAKISKILGAGYKVMASMGHIRDLPGDKMAVDLNNYKPEYKVTKAKVVSDLRKSCANAKCVYIATDDDREGEGIAMHLIEVLKLCYPNYRRMTFREITPKAVLAGLKEANKDGHLNQDKANAYQARRVVDRVVGYTLSPFLWKHVSGAKSAGRVQSVTARLIIDRENLIEEHIPEEKYLIKGEFVSSKNDEIKASLHQIPSEHKVALEVLELCKVAKFLTDEVQTEIVWHSPPPAFKTSVFQQETGKRFGLTPKQAMSIAQKLYEKGEITYHRTDVTRLSNYFIDHAKQFIETKYGSNYLSEKIKKSEDKKVESKKGEQAAHEAIRPTDVTKSFLTGEFTKLEKKVYRLIWIRAVASLMAREKCQRYTVKINLDNTEDYWFVANYLMTLFKGFKILTDDPDNEEQTNIALKDLEKTDLRYVKIESKQSFTEPPKRYTESALVKELENKGIGRPSTYASIIDTVQARKYVVKKSDSPIKKPCTHDILESDEIKSKTVQTTFGDKKKRLFATELGLKTTEFLVKNLDALMEYDFTKSLEGDLDKIANGITSWQDVVGDVHTTMNKKLDDVPDKPPLSQEEKAERKKNKNNRTIGVFEGKKIEFFVTRFGPCLKHDEKWYNLDESYDSSEKITMEFAKEVIQAKRAKDAGVVSYNTSVNGKEGTLKALKGPYGYYLKFFPNRGKPTKNDSYFLSKDIRDDLEAVSALTLEDCLAAVENARNYRESCNNRGKGKRKSG